MVYAGLLGGEDVAQSVCKVLYFGSLFGILVCYRNGVKQLQSPQFVELLQNLRRSVIFVLPRLLAQLTSELGGVGAFACLCNLLVVGRGSECFLFAKVVSIPSRMGFHLLLWLLQ